MSKFTRHLRLRTATVIACGLALASPSVWAAGTASDTDISNNAQVSYQVGGVTQSTQSNTATFKVDNVVRLTVSESGGSATSVVPGASAQVTTFTVTNTGNTTQDYSLVAANLATGQTVQLGATTYTDAFDGTSCQAFVESNANVGYQSGQDTATSISNLAADGTRTVYVVCSIPTGLSNGSDAVVSLTAVTANQGTCATACATTSQTSGANTTGVDVVFGDLAYDSLNTARDGQSVARDAYEVTTAALSINKSVALVCDPFNYNSNPKNVPGAYVRYEITVANAAGSGQSATLTTITDTLPATLGYDADLRQGSVSACATSSPESAVGSGFRLTCTGGTRACAGVGGAVFFTGASGDDAITVPSCLITNPCTVTITAGDLGAGNEVLGTETGYAPGELKPGESITIRFNAIIR